MRAIGTKLTGRGTTAVIAELVGSGEDEDGASSCGHKEKLIWGKSHGGLEHEVTGMARHGDHWSAGGAAVSLGI